MRENNPALPERHGESWTDKEDGKVLDLIQEEYTPEEIAVELKRTTGSIKARLRLLAVEMYKKECSFETIESLTSLSQDEITKCIQNFNEKQLDKKRKDEKLASVPYADLMEIKLILHEMRDIMLKQFKKKVPETNT
jgi:hypothetical protein